MEKVLIIEDEKNIVKFLELELKYEGYDVTSRIDGREGLEEALRNDFDLIILDIMLPSMDGLEVCRNLKLKKDTPVIMLTARGEITDKVEGLQIGAEDYMVKPFAIEELLARMQVIFRRNKNNNSKLSLKDIIIDKTNRTVNKGEEIIALTNKEFELLICLFESKNIVVSREKILEKIWGYEHEVETNVVDVYIRHLRNKLDTDEKEKYIQTIRNHGYIIKS
ncbi:response regulator transcription factor [uncultured Clostridium sp.]|jgi:DNA-binding response OmpR family regulator|uniref:response regulator transcription factor n=1 Tax=uncultured Clostridium sp. TaxID=59620 RepID=UPI0026153CB7|nr:response regulator transcription factor [uncultured Clostridium sp.]